MNLTEWALEPTAPRWLRELHEAFIAWVRELVRIDPATVVFVPELLPFLPRQLLPGRSEGGADGQ